MNNFFIYYIEFSINSTLQDIQTLVEETPSRTLCEFSTGQHEQQNIFSLKIIPINKKSKPNDNRDGNNLTSISKEYIHKHGLGNTKKEITNTTDKSTLNEKNR